VGAFPRFALPQEAADFNAPYRAVIVPAVLSSAVFAIVLIALYSKLGDGRWLARGLSRFGAYSCAAILAGSVVYAVANLRDWHNADAIVSSLLLGLLLTGALVIGSVQRSAAFAGALIMATAPVWVAGLLVARALAIWLSLMWTYTIGRI
jgi:hypothetical protein